MLTAQVGPLRFVEGWPHHSAAIFGCHYYSAMNRSLQRLTIAYRVLTHNNTAKLNHESATGRDADLAIRICYKVLVTNADCLNSVRRTYYVNTLTCRDEAISRSKRF